jgi:transcription elongation factor GreA
MGQHELSRTAHDRLNAELQELTTHGRFELADRIEAARELGDLRENAEYHAAKEEKAKMEARIAQISSILENSVVVEGGPEGDVVQVGHVVHIRFAGDDEVEKYLVGSIEERHDDLHVVSPKSPLGEKLLGSSAGDVVTYTAPSGADIDVEIVEVE